jgi:hypothetical protein
MRVFSENSGRSPARFPGASLLALALAAIFAVLSVSAGALHQHGTGLGTPQIDCKTCSWSHSAGAALGASTPGNAPVEATDLAAGPPPFQPSSDVLSLHLTRGPPCISL